jgi:uroporphyrinogen decarboxylase
MKTQLSPRERFKKILSHQPADRVPLDLAGTSLTGIAPGVVKGIRRIFDLPHINQDDQGQIDEAILQTFEIDFRRIGSLIGSGDHQLPDKPGTRVDIWGVVRAWTGEYWDIVYNPLKNSTIDDLDRYPWPDPEKWIQYEMLQYYQEQARWLWENTEYVIVAEHPVYGIFELACWMCGFDDFLWRLAGDKEYVHKLFKILLELQKKFIAPYYQAIGQFIHMTTSGDDFGTQTGPFLSPKLFRELVSPYFSERIDFTRGFTPGYFWHHTCGSVYSLIPELIEVGVDILNPIQPGAFMMEPDRLKSDFGKRLCFHGGFDTQHVLPFGSQDEVRGEVEKMMNVLKVDGGYIFSAAHNIQEDVPPENVIELFRAARAYGQY